MTPSLGRERCWKCEGEGDDGNPLNLSRCDVCEGRGSLVVGWQPIETAPKDGTPILAFSKTLNHVLVKYDAVRQPERDRVMGRTLWRVEWDGDYLSSEPTHWMLLPPAPERA
jgi:hypothetical protein